MSRRKEVGYVFLVHKLVTCVLTFLSVYHALEKEDLKEGRK